MKPVPKINEEGYRYFSRATDPVLFFCSHTGRQGMQDSFVTRLDELRHRCGFPFVITSGYRDPSHPEEAKKASPGQHSKGVAADIRVRNGTERRILLDNAVKMCFNGIGVAKGFIHVDDRDGPAVAWTY